MDGYLQANPMSSRRIQKELQGVSLLSSGKARPGKPSAGKLLRSGELERYLGDHPMSHRRIQGELQGVSLLAGGHDCAIDEELPEELMDLEAELLGAC